MDFVGLVAPAAVDPTYAAPRAAFLGSASPARMRPTKSQRAAPAVRGYGGTAGSIPPDARSAAAEQYLPAMSSFNVVVESLSAGSSALGGEGPAGLGDLAGAAASTQAAPVWESFVAASEGHRLTAATAIQTLRQGLADAAQAYAATEQSIATGSTAHE